MAFVRSDGLKANYGRSPATRAPHWLADAHRELDEAVSAAYGWPADLTDEQIFEKLLALNLERAKAQ